MRPDIHNFLNALFADLEGFAEIRTLGIPGALPPVRRTFVPTDNLEELADAAYADATEPKANVYVGMATRDNDSSATEDKLLETRVLWADFDALTNDFKREAVLKKLAGLTKQPSLIIKSGCSGYHAYWLLKEPIKLKHAPNRTKLRHTLYGIASTLLSDKAVAEPSRIMRLPGSTNNPSAEKAAKGRVKTVCEIVQTDFNLQYKLSDFKIYTNYGKRLREEETRDRRSLYRRNTRGNKTLELPHEIFGEPNRHKAIVSFAARAARSVPNISNIVHAFNERCCSPPKPDKEVDDIIRWACRKVI
jgi:hypothetical protein